MAPTLLQPFAKYKLGAHLIGVLLTEVAYERRRFMRGYGKYGGKGIEPVILRVHCGVIEPQIKTQSTTVSPLKIMLVPLNALEEFLLIISLVMQRHAKLFCNPFHIPETFPVFDIGEDIGVVEIGRNVKVILFLQLRQAVESIRGAAAMY